MLNRYHIKLNNFVTNTATFSIGDVRYGWIPPQYFFRQHGNESLFFNDIVSSFLHLISPYISYNRLLISRLMSFQISGNVIINRAMSIKTKIYKGIKT